VDEDRELVRALRAQHRGAFDRLYERYHRRIWRYLARVAGNAAEDLFQETWIAAARNAHLLREDSAPLPWLFTIAHNRYRNGARTLARQTHMRAALAAATTAEAAALDETVHLQRQVAKVQAAVARLPVAHREVLHLCLVEGFDACEAGAILGCSSDAVRKRLSRARQELLRLSGADCGRRLE
jgi:RNA polymerase sigma-70 factor (ECF subfamily)